MAIKARKNSIFVVYEGYREGYFLEYLGSLSKVHLNTKFCNGGNADQIVTNGIIHSARDINVYVLFDEDFETKMGYNISDDTLEGLAKAWKLKKNELTGFPCKQLQTLNTSMHNPILVVSNPQSIEGFLLRLLDRPPKSLEGKTTDQLKGMIASFLDNISLNDNDKEQIQIFDKKIARYLEEITNLNQNDPLDKKRSRFLESKIDDYKRNKTKVAFMRFLSEKLPLSVLVDKRINIPEIDILLKAFGL